jgi:hypothetical protein
MQHKTLHTRVRTFMDGTTPTAPATVCLSSTVLNPVNAGTIPVCHTPLKNLRKQAWFHCRAVRKRVAAFYA